MNAKTKKEVVLEVPQLKENAKNVMYVRLTEPLFKRVYAISKEYDTNMSEVARLCIETKLNDVEKLYSEMRKLKRAV